MIQLTIFWDVMPVLSLETNSLEKHLQRWSKYDKDAVRLYVQNVGKMTGSSMQGEQETELMSQKNCVSQYSKSLLAGQSWLQTLVRARSLCQN